MTEPKEELRRPGQGEEAPKNGPPRPLAGVPVPGLSGFTGRPKSLPFYGNYCGPGHGDPTYRTPPVDAVDAACREHNRCYALLGGFDEGCDRNFAKILPTAITETPSQEGKNAGLIALAYFSLAEPTLGLGEALFGGRRPEAERNHEHQEEIR